MKQDAFEAVFVARQPVFTQSMEVWGYELLFRDSAEAMAAGVIDDEAATNSVLADGIASAASGVPGGRKFLVNFPESLLMSEAAYAMPVELGVVEILESVTPSEEVLCAIRELRKEGYTIAVDDFMGEEAMRPLVELADIVKVDVLGLDGDIERIGQVVDSLPSGKTLLAEKVEGRELFDALREMGFDLFQGFFFSKPELVSGKKLSAGEISRMQLMQELGSDDISPERISEILSHDPSLSYRLFRYLNSASFGLSVKINSVHRAVSMLGTRQITQWLRSALLSDLNPSPRGAELAYYSVLRARFMELLCGESEACKIDEPMFIIGLFSLLDAMLDVRMLDVLEELPLDETVKKALTGKSKLHQLLMLAHSFERGYWADCDQRIKTLELSPERVTTLYARARNWAAAVMGAAR